jgi:hypothetical protein
MKKSKPFSRSALVDAQAKAGPLIILAPKNMGTNSPGRRKKEAGP